MSLHRIHSAFRRRLPRLCCPVAGILVLWLTGIGDLTSNPAALDAVVAGLQSNDGVTHQDAFYLISQAIRTTHTNAAARQQLEQRLAAVLPTSAPPDAKLSVCRQLSIIGTAHSVPALAALLPDPDLSHLARFALERIPDASAVAALREALPNVTREIKVGLINSLGERRDASAVVALGGLLHDANEEVGCAAAAALGKIGTLEAASFLGRSQLNSPPRLQAAMADAWLVAAETLARAGHQREALEIFSQLHAREPHAQSRLAVFRGLIAHTTPERAFELLRSALAGSDAPVRNLAARWVADQLDPATVKRLADGLSALPPVGQAALLEALRERGEPAVTPAVRSVMTNASPEVRRAAVRALAVIGDATDVPELVCLASTSSGEESECARLALASLPGQAVDAALISALPSARPEVCVGLLHALAARGTEEGAQVVLPFLKQSGPVRESALKALATSGNEQQIPALIPWLTDAEAEVSAMATRALEAIVSRTGTKSLAAVQTGLEDADTPTRTVLVNQLGTIAGPKALQVLRTVLDDRDPAVREAAFRVLTGWPGPGAVPDLLALAQTAENPAWRTAAFGGFVRLCREAPMPATQRLERLADAAKLAASTGDRLLVISALAEISEPEALRRLATYLEEPPLVEAASVAAVRVASKLDVKDKDAAVPVLRRVIEQCRQSEVQTRARAVLDKWGATTKP